jgi:hypothetical protein
MSYTTKKDLTFAETKLLEIRTDTSMPEAKKLRLISLYSSIVNCKAKFITTPEEQLDFSNCEAE